MQTSQKNTHRAVSWKERHDRLNTNLESQREGKHRRLRFWFTNCQVQALRSGCTFFGHSFWNFQCRAKMSFVFGSRQISKYFETSQKSLNLSWKRMALPPRLTPTRKNWKISMLNELPEILRIRVDVRSQFSKEHDFVYIIVQPFIQCWRFGIASTVGQRFLNTWHKGYGLLVHFPDLCLELLNSESVIIQYNLLDLVFIAMASSRRTDIFIMGGMRICQVILLYRSNIEALDVEGEMSLAL